MRHMRYCEDRVYLMLGLIIAVQDNGISPQRFQVFVACSDARCPNIFIHVHPDVAV